MMLITNQQSIKLQLKKILKWYESIHANIAKIIEIKHDRSYDFWRWMNFNCQKLHDRHQKTIQSNSDEKKLIKCMKQLICQNKQLRQHHVMEKSKSKRKLNKKSDKKVKKNPKKSLSITCGRNIKFRRQQQFLLNFQNIVQKFLHIRHEQESFLLKEELKQSRHTDIQQNKFSIQMLKSLNSTKPSTMKFIQSANNSPNIYYNTRQSQQQHDNVLTLTLTENLISKKKYQKIPQLYTSYLQIQKIIKNKLLDCINLHQFSQKQINHFTKVFEEIQRIKVQLNKWCKLKCQQNYRKSPFTVQVSKKQRRQLVKQRQSITTTKEQKQIFIKNKNSRPSSTNVSKNTLSRIYKKDFHNQFDEHQQTKKHQFLKKKTRKLFSAKPKQALVMKFRCPSAKIMFKNNTNLNSNRLNTRQQTFKKKTILGAQRMSHDEMNNENSEQQNEKFHLNGFKQVPQRKQYKFSTFTATKVFNFNKSKLSQELKKSVEHTQLIDTIKKQLQQENNNENLINERQRNSESKLQSLKNSKQAIKKIYKLRSSIAENFGNNVTSNSVSIQSQLQSSSKENYVKKSLYSKQTITKKNIKDGQFSNESLKQKNQNNNIHNADKQLKKSMMKEIVDEQELDAQKRNNFPKKVKSRRQAIVQNQHPIPQQVGQIIYNNRNNVNILDSAMRQYLCHLSSNGNLIRKISREFDFFLNINKQPDNKINNNQVCIDLDQYLQDIVNDSHENNIKELQNQCPYQYLNQLKQTFAHMKLNARLLPTFFLKQQIEQKIQQKQYENKKNPQVNLYEGKFIYLTNSEKYMKLQLQKQCQRKQYFRNDQQWIHTYNQHNDNLDQKSLKQEMYIIKD